MDTPDNKFCLITTILKSKEQSDMAEMVKDSSGFDIWQRERLLKLLPKKK